MEIKVVYNFLLLLAGYCNLFHKTLHKQTCASVHALLTSEKVVSTNHFCYKRPDSAQLVAANPICSSSVWRAGESQWPVQCWAGLGWAGLVAANWFRFS